MNQRINYSNYIDNYIDKEINYFEYIVWERIQKIENILKNL
jgi:hypothetical protein